MRRYLSLIGLFLLCGLAARAQCTNYTILVSGSGFSPGQISWQLVNALNVVVASGGAPANQSVCLPAGCYTMRMFDSGNNGWGLAPFWINVQPTNTVVAYGTLVNGNFGTQAITLGTSCSGGPCSNYTLTVTAGTSPSQVGWNLVDGLHVVGSGSAPANVTLCLDTGCYSMQLFDSGGNGWNGATWTLTDAGGIPVQSGTLSSGSGGHAAIPLGVPPSTCPGVGPMFAGDCSTAVEICGDHSWLTTPSGFGAQVEAPFNSAGNPYLEYQDGILSTWGTDNDGCLQAGEIHTTWMIINVVSGGTLEFTFGGGGTQAGYYDWIVYPYPASGCAAIQAGTLAPVRCNWNIHARSGTGLSSNPPPGMWANYEPPMTVLAGESYLIGFSNHTAITAMVPLTFGGTADIGCEMGQLPVELLSFEAEAEGREVHLRWNTATEFNSLRFDVDRSGDAGEWIEIGTVAAAGNSLQQRNYALIDPDPYLGMNYYRLRMIDTDGSTEVSPTRAVFMDQHGVLAYPNPSDGHFWIPNADGGIGIFDALGRTMPFELISAQGPARRIFIASPGVFAVRVGSGASARCERVMVR